MGWKRINGELVFVQPTQGSIGHGYTITHEEGEHVVRLEGARVGSAHSDAAARDIANQHLEHGKSVRRARFEQNFPSEEEEHSREIHHETPYGGAVGHDTPHNRAQQAAHHSHQNEGATNPVQRGTKGGKFVVTKSGKKRYVK